MKTIFISRIYRQFGGYIAKTIRKKVSKEDYAYLIDPWNWHDPYATYFSSQRAADNHTNEFNYGTHPLSYYGLA